MCVSSKFKTFISYQENGTQWGYLSLLILNDTLSINVVLNLTEKIFVFDYIVVFHKLIKMSSYIKHEDSISKPSRKPSYSPSRHIIHLFTIIDRLTKNNL